MARFVATVLTVLVLLANVWLLARWHAFQPGPAGCAENCGDPAPDRFDVDRLAARVAFLLRQSEAIAQPALAPSAGHREANDAPATDAERTSAEPAEEPSPEQYAAVFEAAVIVERSIGRGVLMAEEARELSELQRRASPEEFSPILRQLLIALNREQLRFESPDVHFP